jgi:hypothetical protein
MKVKRFVLFAGETYYPSGGWGDFNGSFDTIEEARAAESIAESGGDWTQIIDLETGEQQG